MTPPMAATINRTGNAATAAPPPLGAPVPPTAPPPPTTTPLPQSPPPAGEAQRLLTAESNTNRSARRFGELEQRAPRAGSDVVPTVPVTQGNGWNVTRTGSVFTVSTETDGAMTDASMAAATAEGVNAALEAAQRSGKPVVLELGMEGCAHCEGLSARLQRAGYITVYVPPSMLLGNIAGMAIEGKPTTLVIPANAPPVRCTVATHDDVTTAQFSFPPHISPPLDGDGKDTWNAIQQAMGPAEPPTPPVVKNLCNPRSSGDVLDTVANQPRAIVVFVNNQRQLSPEEARTIWSNLNRWRSADSIAHNLPMTLAYNVDGAGMPTLSAAQLQGLGIDPQQMSGNSIGAFLIEAEPQHSLQISTGPDGATVVQHRRSTTPIPLQ